MAKLDYKLEITGKIVIKTGLHIGGSDVDLDIGGIDSEVAKNKQNGMPYIPGSSLSGKLRHLLAKHFGYKHLTYELAKKSGDNFTKPCWDEGYVALLFAGAPFKASKTEDKNNGIKGGNNFNEKNELLATHTRLLIRDDFMLNPDALIEKVLEDKVENTINRNTGTANPRHIERVISGTEFQLKMVMDVYQHDNVNQLLETLHLGINLLNNDYLGGMGSRGSGEVMIKIEKVEQLVFKGGKIEKKAYNYTFK